MLYMGVDLGGTNIAAGVVSEDGQLLYQDSCPTGAGRPYQEVMADMGALVNRVIKDSGHEIGEFAAVGIGSPGAVDCANGVIVFANNLNWRFVPICKELQKYVDLPAFVDNDANVATLAEIASGCAKGKKNVVLLTLGTGVGGGIVQDGKIIGGSHHVGAEIGHMIVHMDDKQCTCGNKGCLERYTSATALIREGREIVIQYPNSLISVMAENKIENVTAKTVIDAAKAGDFFALDIFERYVHYLALGIISIINLIDPEVIALGGGVSKAGDFLMDALMPEVRKHIFYKDLPWADIMISPLGNEAGIIGAAMLGASCLK